MTSSLIPASIALVVGLAAGAAHTPAVFSGTGASQPHPPTAPQQTLQELIAEARARQRAYDYENALLFAERALALDALSIDANTLLRSLHSRLGTIESAHGRFLELLQQYPDSPVPYYLLGATNPGGPNGRELQRSYLLEALRLDPTFAPALQSLASLSMAERDYERANELARRAMDLLPGPDTALGFARQLQRQDRHAEALALLKQTAARYPGSLRAWTQLWSAELEAQGDDRDITPLLSQINANRHRFMGSMENMELLAGVLDGGGDEGRAQAAQLWLTIAERYPEHPRAEVALVRAAQLVDTNAGLEILERLVDLYPESSLRYAAYQRMIQTLIREERFEKAIELSREVIGLPDPGFDELGAGRDSMARANRWGRSFACIGHAGWFMAGQTQAGPISGVVTYYTAGRAYPRAFSGGAAVSPVAAAAGQSLRDSACREPGVLMMVGTFLAESPSFRPLGIELIELAIAALDRDVAAGGVDGSDARLLGSTVDRLRTDLASHYLEEGRLDEALALIDAMVAASEGRMMAAVGVYSADRIAAQVYEAAGRLEEAKVHYLRVVTTSSTNTTAADALDRIYRRLSSDELETFAPGDSPTLPLRAARFQTPPPLEIEAQLGRLLEAERTLIVVWTPRFAPTRAHLRNLADLGETYRDRGFDTLAIAVARSTRSVQRALEDTPAAGRLAYGTFDDLVTLGIDELPTTLLVNRTGKVLARQMSYGIDPEVWAEQWREIIEKELGSR